MVDRQTQPSSADIQKMQFMRPVTNIHHSEMFRLWFVVLLKVWTFQKDSDINTQRFFENREEKQNKDFLLW